jgi:curved DNA-binding protein CbpA
VIADPFGVLRISPTLELAPIKRAYFDALKDRPPHGDPARFRELRSAYEALTNERSRVVHWLAAIDLERETASFDERFGARLRSVERELEREQTTARAASLFIERIRRTPASEAVPR